uniref:Uncharacterized protein n=1 Tax=Rhizobium rhizogenes TaxID=359 RepID=A0A4P8DKI5_RHIRH|nr:hypothetical protein pTiC5.7_181 [Rhizobium rhizogenes]QCL11009.1 hypothetical protein pTiC6.5_181 [Rhizobium rhizogenes]
MPNLQLLPETYWHGPQCSGISVFNGMETADTLYGRKFRLSANSSLPYHPTMANCAVHSRSIERHQELGDPRQRRRKRLDARSSSPTLAAHRVRFEDDYWHLLVATGRG